MRNGLLQPPQWLHINWSVSFPSPTPQSTKSTWPLFADQSFPEASDGGCQRLKGYKQAVHRLLAHTVVKIWEFHMQIHISGFS